jgi:hypothetical protein
MRETFLTIVTGMMGVGKSYTTRKILDAYKKTGRKILIFDPNDEDTYHDIKTLYFDVLEYEKARRQEAKQGGRIITESEKAIANLPEGEVRRIVPYTKYRDKMNFEQMQLVLVAMTQNFRGGLLILEDINAYISNFESEEIKGAFKNIRHKSQDIIMHCQSLSPLRRIHFEACRRLRMHYDGFNLDLMKDRLEGNFALLKIAQLIIEHEYFEGNERFFLHVETKKKKIIGVNASQFRLAVEKYLTSNKWEFREMADRIAHNNGRQTPGYSDQRLAREEWIKLNWRYIDAPYTLEKVNTEVTA